MSRLRVAVWSTGGVGAIAVQAIARRPDLELAGVWVHCAEKVGLDAGTLTGGEPLGVAATDDADALLAAGPTASSTPPATAGADAAAIDDYVRILEAGVNVVTVSTPGLVLPAGLRRRVRAAQLEAAAERGGATLYASGIEPGFAGDQLVLTLLTMSRTIRSVRAQEIFLYDEYPVAFMMFEVFGFGQPLDHQPIMALPGRAVGHVGPAGADGRRRASASSSTRSARPTSGASARARSRWPAASSRPGTVGAVRMETIGVVDGRDAIVIEHVNRMAPDLAPHWPTAERDGTYRIVVDGDPSLHLRPHRRASPETASDDGHGRHHDADRERHPGRLRGAARPRASLDLPLTLPRAVLD